ncbi:MULTISPECIES: ABC transporter permease [unclassified Oceanispirochaeta]|uniref:ABC transporter permease n=1 Tax=unclassified Oceanispirochaeta TaxID=2635722 RepID=UPI000E0955EB|nr:MULTISPECIES: ribose ABC transporter permease [unclassified Oceanispirochaeta]MBF9018024.1 ribose ABC transporter permease [Oceanispirochaeta sp. M2]NPD74536.1 ribose ABC transporter permease [Oceanispirochaeta sp. M1]RDG29648.1 ribose ABC transporter permease [Oceanispirochaeta sp. M1]
MKSLKNRSTNIKSILKNYGIIIAFFLICLILAIMSPVFLSPINILNVFRQTSIYGIMAVGMTFVILTGGIDLSVGSLLAISGVVSAGMLKAGFGLFPVVFITLLVGFLFGLVNGLIINLGKITPFVVTLGMMSIARGLTLIYSKGYPISGFDPDFRQIGGGYILGIPIPSIIFVATVLLAWGVLTQTRLGRYTYAIGGNEETVRLSGINVTFFKTIIYAISGLTAAISAIIITSRLNSAEPIAGTGFELDVIAAVVIGGTSLQGGRGAIWGTFIGALMIGVINNGMNLLGINAYFQLVVKGIIIIGAVLLDRLRD